MRCLSVIVCMFCLVATRAQVTGVPESVSKTIIASYFNQRNTTSADNIFNLVSLGAIKDWDETKIEIEPNPALDLTYIQFFVPVESIISVLVSNINGSPLCYVSERLSTGIHTYELRDISSGIYIVSVFGDGFIYNTKLLSNNTSGKKSKFLLNNLCTD